MKLKIYIAGPITKGPMDKNLCKAMKAADEVMRLGHVPFIPHLTFLWQLVSPKDYETWMAWDKAWLLSCDAILRIPGESSGADREVTDAKAKGLLVFHSLEDIITWNYREEAALP